MKIKLPKFLRRAPSPESMEQWNPDGRKIAAHNCEKYHQHHTDWKKNRGQGLDITDEDYKHLEALKPDMRKSDLAEAVLAQVVALNQEGRSGEARALFDPAHSPFIPKMEDGNRGLVCCAILGPDEFLVQQGAYYQPQTTWHNVGDEIRQVDNIACFAWSSNRAYFVTVFRDGSLALGKNFQDPNAEMIAAPSLSAFIPPDVPAQHMGKLTAPVDAVLFASVVVSNDGKKILLGNETYGVMLLTNDNGNWQSRLLFPSVDTGLMLELEECPDDEEFQSHLDMLHMALSPDGKLAAFGSQSFGHFIVALNGAEKPEVYAELGYLSEYPHDACFSDDGRFVAFNSCHFYNGITFCSDVAAVKGKVTDDYQKHDLQTILNDYLRVYASSYLPASMTDATAPDGAFLLAGSGFAACVTPQGNLLWEVGFGSSAGGVDVCPITKRVLIASYSGMLHLLDPSQGQDPMIFDGYNAPQELRRWIYWDSLTTPIIW